MNPYLENLNKIEFVVTYACTGRCKHCSEGDHRSCGERIDPEIAKDAVRRITELYDVKTVMAFGGEPLLYPDATGSIICAAKEAGVPVVWVKAQDDVQKMVFEKLGADRVLIPEREAGISVAKNMVSADLLDLIELTEHIRLVELAVREEWVGYSLKELDFRRKYRINVIAVKNGKSINMDLGADDKLEAGTTLYVVGDRKAINKLS